MSRRRGMLVRGLLAVALVVGVAWWFFRPVPGNPDGTRLLTEQRGEVRAFVAESVPEILDASGVDLHHLDGDWQGCHSIAQWVYRDFRYRAAGRLDLPADVSGAEEALVAAFEAVGFEMAPVDSPGDRTSHRGSRADLVVDLSVLPAQRFALVEISGPCVDVPKDERDAWQRRRDDRGAFDLDGEETGSSAERGHR